MGWLSGEVQITTGHNDHDGDWVEPYCSYLSGYQAKANQEDPISAREGQLEAGLLGQDVGGKGRGLLCWEGDGTHQHPD